jgi:hypothetical protein
MQLQAAKKAAVGLATWVAISITFILSAYSLWLDRSTTAAVAGAFMLAMIIFKHLPIIESLKVFTLEAKFVQRIDQADQLLNQVRASARVSSKLLYRQIALAGRLAHMGWSEKRDMVSSFDKHLASLDISESVITDLKKPFFHIISLDLFRIYEHSVSERLREHREQARAAVQKHVSNKPIEAGDKIYAELLAAEHALEMPFTTTRDVMNDGRLDDMAAITAKLINETPLPDEDKNKLEIIRSEVVLHANSCREEGNVTAEAEAYLDKYSPRVDSRVKEIIF